MEKSKYKIRDHVIQLLRRKTYEEVAAPDYTEKVKAEIMREINKHLPEGKKITAVYLSEFLVQ
ncbi:MAG TPA: flagellar basal body-associated FliL family protein [Desulfotomaculum sp.]|nr:flagellar basal body-associated FliL family protein [Desulfotomaculum sp.]